MSNINRGKIVYRGEVYDLMFHEIDVRTAAKIDENSYVGSGFYSLKECGQILREVDFSLYKKGEKIYHSTESDPQKLDFRLCVQICQEISRTISLSKEEIEDFTIQCEQFLGDQTGRMPYELLVASALENGTMSLGVKDLETMPMRQYEKIQIAREKIRANVQ